MAGSYGHVDPTTGGKWSSIENMGDAHECVEQLLYLVRALGGDKEIAEALDAFYRFENGEADPAYIGKDNGETEAMPCISDYGKAYLETKKVMAFGYD